MLERVERLPKLTSVAMSERTSSGEMRARASAIAGSGGAVRMEDAEAGGGKGASWAAAGRAARAEMARTERARVERARRCEEDGAKTRGDSFGREFGILGILLVCFYSGLICWWMAERVV
jgi:hypothetical protein